MIARCYGLPPPTELSTVTRALLRIRARTIQHRMHALELTERLRLLFIVGVLAWVALRWLVGLTTQSFTTGVPGGEGLLNSQGWMDDPAAITASIRGVTYRFGAFLAAVVGFSSFGGLWRATDIEILNRLPISPSVMMRYRLALSLLANMPILCLFLAALTPLFWRGYLGLGLESAGFLVLIYVLTSLWSLRWHMFAGHSVVSSGYVTVKQLLAGTMVLRERTLLLYSPFLGASFGFGFGLLGYVGLTAVRRSEVALALATLTIAIGSGLVAYRGARALFVKSYYQALSALADGELLGEVSETAPGPSYLGQWYVEKLPAAFQGLVARDLRQMWRRSRLDHLTLITGSGAIALVFLRRGDALGQSGWLWPVLWIGIATAGAEAFRMTRSRSDAAWIWLSLPISLGQQRLARVLSTLFFSLLIGPGLWLAAGWAGLGWLEPLAWILSSSVLAAIAASNLALTFFTQPRIGGTLYFGLMGVALGTIGRSHWMCAGILAIVCLATFWPAHKAIGQLSGADQAR